MHRVLPPILCHHKIMPVADPCLWMPHEGHSNRQWKCSRCGSHSLVDLSRELNRGCKVSWLPGDDWPSNLQMWKVHQVKKHVIGYVSVVHLLDYRPAQFHYFASLIERVSGVKFAAHPKNLLQWGVVNPLVYNMCLKHGVML